MKGSIVTDVINRTEVSDNLMQNIIIVIQKETLMRIIGVGKCLAFIACFVGLFVFSTQYDRISKKIAFRNEGMTDYLLFKENQ